MQYYAFLINVNKLFIPFYYFRRLIHFSKRLNSLHLKLSKCMKPIGEMECKKISLLLTMLFAANFREL